ncbi:MAG: KpsF/GutQ family sugar-phosphate isomerase [Planctomycetota bacterium]
MDLEFARRVIRTEAEAVRQLEERLAEDARGGFLRAGELILERTGERPGASGGREAAPGRLVVTGVGKAGKIADKLVATFASTGTPSFFLNPTDALHGDLGMVSGRDVLLVLSNSGKTAELLRLVPHLRKVGAPMIVVTGDPEAPLAQPEVADVVIPMGKVEEAGDLRLAPSSSTTAMLALGDALALAVQKERSFTGDRFARFHPAGELAKKAVRVRDIMRTGERVPTCSPETPTAEAIVKISAAHAGSVSVLDAGGGLAGIFTDGDFRRVCASEPDVLTRPVGELMTADPKRIGPERLVGEAMALMRDLKINELPVVDDGGRVVGLLDIQDIVGLRLEI